MKNRREFLGFGAGFALTGGGVAWGADWPYWRGLHRDGSSRETGLSRTWPTTGPRKLWETPLQGGYTSFTISRGRLLTMTEDRKQEIVLCLDVTNGKELWRHEYPADYDQYPMLDQRFKSGPRSTPVIEGDRVFSVGVTGIFNCLDLASGRVVWTSDLLKQAGREIPMFGYCGSPLIDDRRVYVHPGGPAGKSLAALERDTGKLLWQSESDAIGYSSPILIEHEGQAQLIHFTAVGLVAVKPEDGAVLWRFDWKTAFDLNVATPIHQNGQLFLSSNYGKGCAVVELKKDAPPVEVWRGAGMQNHFSTCVYRDGYLYGFSNDQLRCAEWKTGMSPWTQRGFGRGSVILVDGLLVVQGEQGDLALVEATPTAYKETAKWKALEGPCWNAPAFADGRLFVRNQDRLLALDLKRP